MSGRRAGKGGRRSSSRDRSTGSNTVTVSRPKGSSTYSVREKATRSMSELSSLSDISTADLSGLDVMLESSVLKVSRKISHIVAIVEFRGCSFVV